MTIESRAEQANGGFTRGTAPGQIEKAMPWWHARAWQTNLALVLVGLFLLLLSRHLVFEYDDYTIGFSGTSGWSVWCYLAGVFLVLTQPVNRWTLPIILTVATLSRLATLFSDPVLSSDVYRYVWDGIVQHAGINPYRYVPADAHLAFLRGASDGNIYPMINRVDYARTIYPPFAQMVFYVVTFISPTLTMMKTTMVLCEALSIVVLLALFRHLHIRREQILLYAWCPALIWEIAGSGHLDGAVILLVSAALLFRYRRQPVLTGLFFGMAIATKFYPAVLLPALLTSQPPSPDQRPLPWYRIQWSMPLTALAVVAFGYLVYSSAGRLIFGFLGGYVVEEGMSTGSRYFLLEQAQRVPGLGSLSTTSYLIFSALIFAALGLWAWRRSAEPLVISRDTKPFRRGSSGAFLPGAFALAIAMMLLFSPHYPWYVVWLIPFLALMPNLPALAYVLGLFYLCTTALAVGHGPKQFLLNQILYAGVLAAVLLHFASLSLRRRFPLLARGYADVL